MKHRTPPIDLRGELNGGAVYMTTASTVVPLDGETMMEAINRTQARARADMRSPDVLLTASQCRDLQIEILDARAVLGISPSPEPR